MATAKEYLIAAALVASPFIGVLGTGLLIDIRQARNEADAYLAMQRAHLPYASLCEQAGKAQRAYAKAGYDSRAQSWTDIEAAACLNAEICPKLEGGCAR